MLSATSQCMKYILFIFNFVFVLTGIALISIGLIIRSVYNHYKYALNEDLLNAPSVLIFIGCFVFLVSFFGCCGAIRENQLMIFTFSVIMASIFIAELAIGITGYALKAEASEMLTNELTESMKNYKQPGHPEATAMWNDVQGTLSCCGAKNYTDWQPILNNTLPLSCCTPVTGAIGVLSCNPESPTLHRTPCLKVLETIVKDNASLIGITGVTIAVIQLLGVIFSCSLACSIRHDYESV